MKKISFLKTRLLFKKIDKILIKIIIINLNFVNKNNKVLNLINN